MADKLTLDEKVDQIMIDLASVKTDITWLKRLFLGSIGSVITVTVYVTETGLIV